MTRLLVILAGLLAAVVLLVWRVRLLRVLVLGLVLGALLAIVR